MSEITRLLEAVQADDRRAAAEEPDFDAVRNRADFQKLFAEVEAKIGSKTKE